LTAGDLEPLLEQYGAGKLVTPARPATATPRATARPVVTTRPATPVRPAAATPPPSPVRPATPAPSPVRPAPPAPSPVRPAVTETPAEPEQTESAAPAEVPAVAAESPEPVAAPAETEPAEATDVPRPSWPRPAELYLVSLVEGGEPSAEAEYRLEELSREYSHPGENGEAPFRVELFWADDGQGQDPPRTLRGGVHVIRVYSQKQGRALVGSRTEAPGLVLQAYTDEFAYPRRTYCYLLTRETTAKPAFGDLRKGLATIGEKPNFRNSFQVPRKIEALLALWPDLEFDPR
ncbi:hypothetical protein ACGFMK_26655, partial [Amycolatopsis sp. NPDC049252]